MNVKLMFVAGRHNLRQAAAKQAHLTLVAEASTGAQGLKLVEELRPDLVVMDSQLPDIEGFELARQIFRIRQFIKIIVVSGDARRSTVERALEVGICGFLSTHCPEEEFLRAICVVMEGRLYLSPEMGAGILEDYRKKLGKES